MLSKLFLFFRKKSEADGFVRSIMIEHSLSMVEVLAFFNIGSGRVTRLKSYDPTKPVPQIVRPRKNAMTAIDKEYIRKLI